MTDNETDLARAASELGKRRGADTIYFERVFDAPLERVWRALTTPEGLEPWLGPATVDLRPLGTFSVRLNENVVMDGRIVTLEPPATLTLVWRELEDGVATAHATTEADESELSFQLRAEGRGTRLVLTHRLIRAGESMNEFGAGWHAYLESLRAALAGSPQIDVGDLYRQFRPAYVEAFGT